MNCNTIQADTLFLEQKSCPPRCSAHHCKSFRTFLQVLKNYKNFKGSVSVIGRFTIIETDVIRIIITAAYVLYKLF
jgi:hypothetical protein